MVKKFIAVILLCSLALPSVAFKQKKHDTPVKDALGSVEQISRELKDVEGIAVGLDKISRDLDDVKVIAAKLDRIENHLGRIETSLAPIGSLARPETLRGLILLMTGCGAFLIVLHALLRRWTGGAKSQAH